MRPFEITAAGTAPEALRLATEMRADPAMPIASTSYLAGGTNLLDLMKLDVMRPDRVVSITPLAHEFGTIAADAAGLRLGALVRMAEAADHPFVRADYPVIADSLWQAASPQLRNMATLGGNVLQRTRCPYFRDRTWHGCNKRNPGAGCTAIDGVNRRHAILGVSEHCIASYPGDFAIALVALGAEVDLLTPGAGARSLVFEELHRLPGNQPDQETNLAEGELITGFRVPAGPWTRRSRYLKVRDRTSYDFALASAAVALELAADGTVREARVGIGGLVSKPWRAHEAEDLLRGARIDETTASRAADAAFASAITHSETGFKPDLGRRTLVRALLETAAMEVA